MCRGAGKLRSGRTGMAVAQQGITRRRMIGYLIAGPTLISAVTWRLEGEAKGAIPSVQPYDHEDLSDQLTQAATPTMSLITVTMNKDGSASFDLPRTEVGQGITTAFALVIADELDLPMDKVHVTLADAKPELVMNQLTGGSNTMHALYEPVRTAAASARDQMMRVAAADLAVAEGDLVTRDGAIVAADGRSISYGALAERAAVDRTRMVKPRLNPRAAQVLVGKGQRRIDAHEAVTGAKPFAMDIKVPNALPAMVCRPPTINGSVKSVKNLAAVKAMPGVTDVVVVPHTDYVAGGVAVRAKTFGQCIDAVRALQVDWAPGPAVGKSDATVLADLKAAERPMTPAPPGDAIEEVFTFHFRPGDPLETNAAVADVRADKAEIWSSLKSPIWTKQTLSTILGLSQDAIAVHVTQGGGSFGRHLFSDAAYEAAVISQLVKKPVRLMWHRTDNFRQGRVHPMSISRVRVVSSGGNVVAFDQRHTAVFTDVGHGFGEAITANGAATPQGNSGYGQDVFNLTQNVPYNFGAVSQLLFEIYDRSAFNTSSVRNVYSPDVATATELMVDQAAKALKQDPLAFRHDFAKDDRMRAVLDKLKQVGGWGRTLPAGVAQGIACRNEYKGRAACLIEVDTRPATVNRKVRDAYTGPRVRRAVFVVDVGLPINPLGLKAQMMGGMMDGIAQALTYGLHLKDGNYLEGSWDDAYYTRQWNVPPKVEIYILPP